MKELVIIVNFEADKDKREELIARYCFDAMFAIQQGIEQLFLKSQGNAISVCADVVLEIERRLENQFIPIKKRIYLNSRFFEDKYQRKGSKKPRNYHGYALKKPGLLSYMDVKFFFKP